MRDEIASLNVDDLDVEELEQRLELAVAAPHLLGWGCVGVFTCCDGCCAEGCGVEGCGVDIWVCKADR